MRLDELPWSACSRALLGSFIVPAASRLMGEAARSGWALGAFLLGVMFATRLVPAVARAFVPFSQAALKVWGYRRGLGKRYDSYQWQKLFWIGLGMFGQILISRDFYAASTTVSTMCIGAGFAGWIAWRTVDVRVRNGIDAGADRQRSLAIVASQPTAP